MTDGVDIVIDAVLCDEDAIIVRRGQQNKTIPTSFAQAHNFQHNLRGKLACATCFFLSHSYVVFFRYSTTKIRFSFAYPTNAYLSRLKQKGQVVSIKDLRMPKTHTLKNQIIARYLKQPTTTFIFLKLIYRKCFDTRFCARNVCGVLFASSSCRSPTFFFFSLRNS